MGVRQLSCREGTNARSFDRGRENLKHAVQVAELIVIRFRVAKVLEPGARRVRCGDRSPAVRP